MGDTVLTHGATLWQRILVIPLLSVFMLFVGIAPAAATQEVTFEELFGEEPDSAPADDAAEGTLTFEELFGTPEPTEPVDPTPVEEPAEERSAIVLPEFENGGTILMTLAIVAVVIIAILIGWRIVVSNKHKAAELRDQRAAQQDDKKAALQEWKKHTDAHQELKNKVWNAETDWDILFYYPAINDPTVPETRDLRFAMDKLDSVSSEPPSELSLSMDITEMHYPKAVLEAKRTWDVAWYNARVIRQSSLSVQERKTIDKIMDLLSLARNGASTENEKHLAYQRIDALVESLTTIVVPERAKELLDREHYLVLEASNADTLGSIQDFMTTQAEHTR